MSKWGPILQGLSGPQKTLINSILQSNSQQMGPFTKFAFPLIRKSFPQIVSQNLVSVQPMTGPVGGIFFYNPYGSPQNPMSVGDAVQTTRKINKKIIIGIVQEIVTGWRRGIKLKLAVVENASTGKRHRIEPSDLRKVTPLDVMASVN